MNSTRPITHQFSQSLPSTPKMLKRNTQIPTPFCLLDGGGFCRRTTLFPISSDREMSADRLKSPRMSAARSLKRNRASRGVQPQRKSPSSAEDCDTRRRSLWLINRLSGVNGKKKLNSETPIEATTTISKTPDLVLLKDHWGSKRSRGYSSGIDKYYEEKRKKMF